MESKNFNINLDDGVMLRLETYNELYDHHHALVQLISDTNESIRVVKRETTSYDKTTICLEGHLTPPRMIIDQIASEIATKLAASCHDEDFRSLVEGGVHRVNLGDMTFESFAHKDNPLEVDLLRYKAFAMRWEATNKAMEGDDNE